MDLSFFGDGPWATECLQRLIEDGHDIRAVVLRKNPSDSAFPKFASTLGVPVLSPEKVNDPAFVKQVKDWGSQLNISMSYDQILRQPILDAPQKGFINVHAGKLPFYRGRSVVNWAIINNETEIGLTVHYIDTGIDTGSILVQETLPIEWEDTYGSLLKKIVVALPDLMSRSVALVGAGEPGRAQNPQEGTYFGARGPGDEWIDWRDTSLNIYNKIRAITDPGPGARVTLGDRTLLIWSAEYDLAWPKYIAIPGQVVSVEKDQGITIKTGDSTIKIKCVQFDEPGEKRAVPGFRLGTRF